MTARGVVIAGMGCVCSCGRTAPEALEGAVAGQARFVLPQARVRSTYTQRYPVFEVAEDIVAACPAGQSLSQHFFITASKEAFFQAQITPEQLSGYRVGVIVGTSVDASFHCFNLYHHWKKHILTPLDVTEFETYLSSAATAKSISRYFGFTGPFQTIVTACASGTDAVGLGKSWIENDVCDVVLCGGADEINLVPYDGFIRLLVASPEKCRPFSSDRNGINIGEGAGALLLVSPRVQREFSVSPKGFVLGYGNACDAFHPTAPDPQAKGLQKAISFALSQAGLTAQELAFVNAHGTASPANDAAESVAFRALLSGVPVWGSKGVTGHTLGAAGAVEAVLSLQVLNRRILPPTTGFRQFDNTIGFSPTLKTTPLQKKVALSDSLAFGGCNAAIVLGAEDFYA